MINGAIVWNGGTGFVSVGAVGKVEMAWSNSEAIQNTNGGVPTFNGAQATPLTFKELLIGGTGPGGRF